MVASNPDLHTISSPTAASPLETEFGYAPPALLERALHGAPNAEPLLRFINLAHMVAIDAEVAIALALNNADHRLDPDAVQPPALAMFTESALLRLAKNALAMLGQEAESVVDWFDERCSPPGHARQDKAAVAP